MPLGVATAAAPCQTSVYLNPRGKHQRMFACFIDPAGQYRGCVPGSVLGRELDLLSLDAVSLRQSFNLAGDCSRLPGNECLRRTGSPSWRPAYHSKGAPRVSGRPRTLAQHCGSPTSVSPAASRAAVRPQPQASDSDARAPAGHDELPRAQASRPAAPAGGGAPPPPVLPQPCPPARPPHPAPQTPVLSAAAIRCGPMLTLAALMPGWNALESPAVGSENHWRHTCSSCARDEAMTSCPTPSIDALRLQVLGDPAP
jgi:hypothetical protein